MSIPSNSHSFSDYGHVRGQRLTARSQNPVGKPDTRVSESRQGTTQPDASAPLQQVRDVRADNYVEALRELKAQDLNPKHARASNTFLEIAHFENEPRLVDVYA